MLHGGAPALFHHVPSVGELWVEQSGRHDLTAIDQVLEEGLGKQFPHDSGGGWIQPANDARLSGVLHNPVHLTGPGP